jgi:NAD(P)H-dependent FMN reductase
MSTRGTVAVRRVIDGTEVGASTLLGVCASMKPADTAVTRALVCYALESISTVYPAVALLDLRDHALPLFDGRAGAQYGHPTLDLVSSCVDRAPSLLLAVPAYWSGVSGVFKNFVDTLCGAAYNLTPPYKTVFTGKLVGLLVVGADERSAAAGARHAVEIMESTGARLAADPVIVSNPRGKGVDAALLSRQLLPVAGALAGHALEAGSAAETV